MTRRRRLALAVAAVVLVGAVVAALLVLAPWRAGPDVEHFASGARSASPIAVRGDGGGNGDDERVDRAAADRASAHDEVAPLPAHLDVRVLQPDGDAAAGARVDVGELEPAWIHGGWQRPREFDPARIAATAVTGADGRARLPWRNDRFGSATVRGTLGSWHAEQRVSVGAAAAGELVLRLDVDATLRVSVRDGDDLPLAGVMVTARGPARDDDGAIDADRELAHALTGADGVATFAHTQRWRERLAPPVATRTVHIAARVPGGGVQALLAAADLAGDVVLRTGPTGAVEIAVEGAAELPDGAGPFVVLAPPEEDDGERAFELHPLERGVASFASVPLGRRWQAWVPGWSERLDFVGPGRRGEVVRVQLAPDAGSRFAALGGVLLANGTPVSDWQLALDADAMLMGSGRTAPAGRFLVTLFDRPPRLTLRVLACDPKGNEWHAEWSGALAPDALFTEVGTLTLVPVASLPLLAAGRVVGTGLEDVVLRVGGESTELAPDGTFAAHGRVPPDGVVTITAHSKRHGRIEPIDVAAGTRDVRVVLRSLPSLVVPIRTGSRELALALAVGLREPGECRKWAGESEPERAWSDDGVLTCTWPRIEPGRHELLIAACEGADAALLRVAVDVPARGTEPIVLAPVELPSLRLVRLRLPKPVKSRATPWRAFVERRVGGETCDAGRQEGDTWLLAATAPLDVTVSVPGFRERALRGVFADQDVVLAPAIAVDVEVDVAALPAQCEPRLQFDSTTGGFVCVEAGFERSGHHRLVRLALPRPGAWSIEARDGRTHDDLVVEPAELEIPEHGGTFRVRVRPRR
jgi:hypothetical protein